MYIYFQCIWSALKMSNFTCKDNVKACVDEAMWLKDIFYTMICAAVIFLIYTQAYTFLTAIYIHEIIFNSIPD